jgi:hypothetical protein
MVNEISDGCFHVVDCWRHGSGRGVDLDCFMQLLYMYMHDMYESRMHRIPMHLFIPSTSEKGIGPFHFSGV